MEYVYILEHIYEKNEEEEIKFIGVFSSLENAQEAVKYLAVKPGFKDYPLDCFKIEKSKLDRYEWKDGFISWEEAMEE